MDNVTQSINILPEEHQETHNCIIKRVSSTDLLESTGYITLRIQYDSLTGIQPFILNFFFFALGFPPLRCPLSRTLKQLIFATTSQQIVQLGWRNASKNPQDMIFLDPA